MAGRFAGERAVVIGLGVAGAAAARVLAEEGARVLVTESGTPPVPAGLEALGVDVRTGGHAAEHFEDATMVVTSPGVPEGAEVLTWARWRGLPVWSELELGARLARAPYAAVTGTNGKTTTTEMLVAAMRAAGIGDALACGNVGYPFSLAAREPHGALAVEASSFQLRFQESFHPRASVLLNLAPDHLDWHGSIGAYVEAKARLYANQSGSDVHVGNLDDARAAEVSRRAPCEVRWFTLGEPQEGQVGYVGERLVSRVDDERVLGVPAHDSASHRADAAAAAATAIAFGLDPDPAGRAVCAFTPLEHRGGVVAEIAGIRFVDDSKATNPHAAVAAVEGLDGVVLIAGGRSKGVDLSPLARLAPSLAGVVAIGEAAAELTRLFEGLVPVERAEGMSEAVDAAAAMASPGGVVLLAPACASQDMFRDYAERGERFAEAVARLQRGRAHAG